jgi:hypothetical protein
MQATVEAHARESRLLGAFAEAAHADFALVSGLAVTLLGECDAGTQFRSRLNNDGSPLQACVSLRRGAPAWRLVADPHSHITDSAARFAAARQVAREVLALRTDDAFARLVDAALDRTPASRRDSGTRWSGAIWTCAALAGPGAAIYVDARWGGIDDRWPSTMRWIQGFTGRPPCAAVRAAGAAGTRLAAVSVEGHDLSGARVKLYFRVGEAVSLAEIGCNAWQRSVLSAFAETLGGSGRIDREGLLLCLGLDAETGGVRDVKLDVCGHCLGFDSERFGEWLERIGTSLGIVTDDLGAMRLGERADLAFVGCGVTAAGDPRVNVYFKGHAA